MNDAELELATRELNVSLNEVVRYMNNRSDFFIVNVGAFKVRFNLAKLVKPKEVGSAKLREALKLCMDEMCNRCRDLAAARGNPLPCLNGCEPVRRVKAALAVTGCFLVNAVLTSNASHIWYASKVLNRVWKSGSVDRDFLFKYCGGAAGKCYAILAEDPWRFPETEWVKLEKYAVRSPQSWQTLRANNSGENALARSLLHILKRAVSQEMQG